MKIEINYQKNKIMTINSNDNNKWAIMYDGKQHDIETVRNFKYLGLELSNGRNILQSMNRVCIGKLKDTKM